MEKCLKCDLFFDTHQKMKKHHRDNHFIIYTCGLCPKTFQNEDEVKHHLYLEHRGMSSAHLNRGAAALQTKKQLGDYLNNGINLDCSECFEIFPTVDKLEEHRIKNHNKELTNEAKDKLKKLVELDGKEAPQCEICTKRFLGLVVCKIDGKAVGACINCYADHFGENALARLTIGTPDEMIKKMKSPLV